MFTDTKKSSSSRLIFPVVAMFFVLFSYSTGLESNAFSYLQKIEKRNIAMLSDLAEINMVLSELDSLNIALISGKLNSINHTIDKAEKTVFLAAISSFSQRMLVQFSKNHYISGITILFILLTFFHNTSALAKKLVVLLILVSPGLSLYSIGVHHLSTYTEDALGGSLPAKLDSISRDLSAEKSKLLQARDSEDQKAAHEDRFNRFLSHIRADATYEIEKFGDDIKEEYVAIRTILRMGGHTILDDLLAYTTHSILFMVFSPLIYFYILVVAAPRLQFSSSRFTFPKLSALLSSHSAPIESHGNSAPVPTPNPADHEPEPSPPAVETTEQPDVRAEGNNSEDSHKKPTVTTSPKRKTDAFSRQAPASSSPKPTTPTGGSRIGATGGRKKYV